jgi:hypothetical protein
VAGTIVGAVESRVNKNGPWARDLAKAVECLSNKCEALSLNSCTVGGEGKRKEEGGKDQS